jgi:sulfoxide reductase heme-binding subunit YedZ
LAFLREKNGAISPHKLIAFTGASLPALYLLGRMIGNDLGAQPLVELTHQTGDWSVRLLFLSLCITPARRLFNAPKLILTRRTLGVAAFFYALAHFFIYVIDQNFVLGTVAREIALRLYLTIGFTALLGLTALGITSTDGMVRRLGAIRWNRLHKITYVIAILTVIHFMMQKKLNIYEPTWMAGLLAWLLFYRYVQKRADEVRLPHLIGLVIAATLFTVAAEALWYGLLTGVDWRRVLQANLMFPDVVRPAWVVLFTTSGVSIAALVAQWLWPRERARAKLRAAE